MASSDKVYGEGLSKKEEDRLDGYAPYEVSKICTDKLAQCYMKTYGMNLAITRCVNIYGAGDKHMSRLIPYTISQALKDKPIEIRSDGHTIRDYVYVKDVIDAYLKLGENNLKGAFNFGTNSQVETIALVKMIIRLCKSKSKINILNTAKNEIHEQGVNSMKAQTLLNWKPIALEQGLKETIKWWENESERN